MDKTEARFKMGWINPFTVIGSLWGWYTTHTWQGAAWGFGGGILAPFVLVLLVIGVVAVSQGVSSLTARRVSPRYRVEVPGQTVEDPWAQAYAEHCEANSLPNELRA